MTKYKVGELLRTTARYKKQWRELDICDWGFCWDICEVIEINGHTMTIQIFGPTPLIRKYVVDSWFFEKL